jgi:flagellar protein FlaJ
MFKYILEIVFAIIGCSILLISNLVVSFIIPWVVPILNVVGGLIAVIPPVWILYVRYKVSKEIEQQFIVFIKDLTESINSGMTLPMALEHCSKRNYMSLSSYINDLASQIDWGVPFRKAFKIFGKKTQSATIKRAVSTIIETYEIGGKISDTLNAISESLTTIDRIKKERAASVHAQIVTSYLIFFSFIFILVILQMFLIPALSPGEIPGIATSPMKAQTPSIEMYSSWFINFIIVQGFFSGLATGKMAEGSIIAGFKHSILLIVIGYTFFSLASQMQIKLF